MKRLLVFAALLVLAMSAPATAQDFSSGVEWLPTSTDRWGKHAESGHSGDLIEDRSVDGRPALPFLTTRVTLHKGDRFAGSARSEWRPSPTLDQAEGEEYWLGWSFYLPPGYPDPGGWGRLFAQMHGSTNGSQPTWALRHAANGGLYLDVRGGSRNANLRSPQVLPSIARGHVYEIKMFVRASSKSDGITKVWLDGQLRIDSRGPNKYAGRNGYAKFGLYGSDTTGQSWMGGWIKSRNESDIDLMHSLYDS